MAYPLSSRQLEALRQERGVSVDQATMHPWVLQDALQLEAALHRLTQPMDVSCRLDETSIGVWGHWHSLDRAVDTAGQPVDVRLTAHQDESAARCFHTQAIRRHGVPETITIDRSEANAAAIRRYNAEHGAAMAIRQVRYLNNVVEQDHRALKQITRPMLGFKSFEAAQYTLAGVELMHMLRKGQLEGEVDQGLTVAQQFYSLAA